MYCKHCGAEMEEGEVLCPACGKPQEEAPEEIAVTEGTAENEVTVAATEEAVTAEETTAEDTAAAEEACAEAPESAAAEAAEALAEEPAEMAEEEQAAQEPPKKKMAKWKIATLIAGGVLLALALTALILHSMGFRIPTNDIFRKDRYTVSDETAVKKADTVVAEMGGVELTNGALQAYYWIGAANYINAYQSYLSMMGLDLTKPFSEQSCTGKEGYNWEQFFLENAITTWKQYTALCLLAEKEGTQLTQEDETYLENLEETLSKLAEQYGFETVQDMVEADVGPGVTVQDYAEYMRSYFLATTYYQEQYQKIVPTDADIEAYFAEHEAALAEKGITKEGSYATVRHILICPEGGTTDENGVTTYSDAEWEACRVKAQDLYDQWQAGEATEESFAKLASEKTEDPGSKSSGGLYENFTQGEMVEEFEDWSFDESRAAGDHGLIKTKFGYHIMYYLSSEAIWSYQCRNRLIAEQLDALIETGYEMYPMTIHYGKIALGAVNLNG